MAEGWTWEVSWYEGPWATYKTRHLCPTRQKARETFRELKARGCFPKIARIRVQDPFDDFLRYNGCIR